MITSTSKSDRLSVAVALVLMASLPAVAGSVETPEAFVRRVYARYQTVNSPGVPMNRPGGAAFYTAALLDAVAKASASADGETGAIDSDPICVCQTSGPVRIKTVRMIKGTADTVRAQVTFDYLSYITLHDAPKLHPESVVLTLSRAQSGWRIADVGNRTMRSIMAALQDANAPSKEGDTTKQK